MKIRFTTVALLATLCLPIAGCQKTDSPESITPVEQTANGETVSFCIDGWWTRLKVEDENEWDELLRSLMALAREGYEVTVFRGPGFFMPVTKEKLTYTTSSEQDAINWSTTKTKEGYAVTISFDDKTGIYTCIAVK